MIKIKSATRLALFLGVGCATLVWIAIGLGLISDPYQAELQRRIELTRHLAVNVTAYAENRQSSDLQSILLRSVQIHPELISAAVRPKGRRTPSMVAGPHTSTWREKQALDPSDQMEVEILTNGRKWGQLEVAFAPMEQSLAQASRSFPFGVISFIASAMSLLAWIVLSRTLRYLNPSRVVPTRVRSALDTLTEGLVLLDKSGQIAHANEAFRTIVACDEQELLGTHLDDFKWSATEKSSPKQLPWTQCLIDENPVCGDIIELTGPRMSTRKFVINATPILDGNGSIRGVLASFDDVTAMENKNAELAKIIGTLRSSRDEVARQNRKLNFLASYDPLTKCMNRRAFFAKFETMWADPDCSKLNLIMLDVDFFKAVNDNHGHSVGDEVLKAIGSLLRNAISDKGLVCRHGGEEFVMLIPHKSVSDCVALANNIRETIKRTETCGINFTASFGVSCRAFKPMDPQHMLDQADESLYIAKRNGRNRVIRFDERDDLSHSEVLTEDKVEAEIPYSAVSGLLSALSFRCPATAEHSIRVADLCVGVGEEMMNSRELYRLEISALLHDIGKIGVPDSILHKPAPLTPEEWSVMRKHDDIGVSIVRSAFASEYVANAIESHHNCSQRHTDSQHQENEVKDIPLAAKIIIVCDAYDSMTNDQPYRKAMTPAAALKEMEFNCPIQFDRKVFQVLYNYIANGCYKPSNPKAADLKSDLRSATSLGQHIEELYTAIHEEDLEGLRSVVNQLKQETVENEPVAIIADRLDDAINTPNGDLQKVLSLANEVMDICRASRSRFVNVAETIVGKNSMETK